MMVCRKYLVLIIAVLLFSCEKNDPAPENDHVLMVYLAGDSNLSGEIYEKLEAIEKGFLQFDGGRLFVYFDKRNEAPCLQELIRQGTTIVRKTVTDYEEHNSASSAVFGEVIRKITMEAPAKSYGLLFFSHATGWFPEGAYNNPSGYTRSIGQDGTDEMELADFASAIPDGLFDYIVFEACYMACTEAAYMLRNKTGYLLASSAEIVSPGFRDIYPTYLPCLFNGTTGLQDFAEAAYDWYNNQKGWMRSATYSLIRTEGVNELMDFVRRYYPTAQEINTSGIQAFDRYSRHLFFDLENSYMRILADDTAAQQELKSLIDKCVIWKEATPSFLPGYNGFPVENHSGLTIYLPQSYFPALNEKWLELFTNQ